MTRTRGAARPNKPSVRRCDGCGARFLKVRQSRAAVLCEECLDREER